MTRVQRALARLLPAVLLFVAPLDAGAQVPVTGFRSTGTLVVAATIAGSPLNVGGTISVYRRGSRYRLDLLTLGFPGVDPTASAVAGALLVPGGATLLYDGNTGAVSAYANGNHTYYTAPPSPPAPAETGQGAPAAAAGDADPLAALAGIARQLHDVTQARIELTGHGVVNGHPTDDLDVVVQRARPGKPVENYHAQISLADDLAGFPVRLSLSSTPPSPQDFGGSLRLDLTSIAAEPPDDAVFAIPPGYTRVDSLGAVLQPRR